MCFVSKSCRQIGAKIDEILSSGGLRQLDEARADEHLQTMTALTSVHGIGVETAKMLMETHHVTSVPALALLDQQHPEILNKAQKLGIDFICDFFVP